MFNHMRVPSDNRNDRPEMSRPQAPKMEIGKCIALGLDCLTQLVGHALVGIHIEQIAPVSRIKP